MLAYRSSIDEHFIDLGAELIDGPPIAPEQVQFDIPKSEPKMEVETPSSGPALASPPQAPVVSSDLDGLRAPSAGIWSVDMRDYWPQPPPGKAVITELSYDSGSGNSGSGNSVPYQVDRYRRHQGDQFFLENYIVSPGSSATGALRWAFTWLLQINNLGVNEILDTSPDWMTRQVEKPIIHGLTMTVGQPYIHLAEGTVHSPDGSSQIGTFWNQYFKRVEDVKTRMRFPSRLEFENVMIRSEQQYVQVSSPLKNGSVDTKTYIVRNRFYHAKGKGLFAIQWYNSQWQTGDHVFLYASKHCVVDASVFRCP